MAEAGPPSQSYQYACQRAELLGKSAPTEAEWFASDEYAAERAAAEQDSHDDAVAQELDQNDESMNRVGGGLDELNTILNATQKKINKFKTVCGSLGTLLKARVSSQPGTPDHKPRSDSSSEPQASASGCEDDTEAVATSEDQQPASPEGTGGEVGDQPRGAATRKHDLNSKVTSHLDKLDSLIMKADNAQYSMKHQTKQMKSFMK